MIRLATEKNSRNETTRSVNVPTKEITEGEMTTINETIGIIVAMMGKETAVGIKTRSRTHTTTGIAHSVQILISVSVKTATNVTLHAPVAEDNQIPEIMGKETVATNKATTHTTTGIAPSVRILILVSVKTATNATPHVLALQVTVDKGQILDLMAQTTEGEVDLEETIEVKAVNVQTTEGEEVLEETIEVKAANAQTTEGEEDLAETTEVKVVNARIKTAVNQIHNTVKHGGKVRIMHTIDPQRK